MILHETGEWSRQQVRIAWTQSGRAIVPDVESQIDREWRMATANPSVRLFDGPMCRMESWRRDGESLVLELSRTSYRVFLGTNLRHAELDARLRANPIGVSPALLTSDGFLMLGMRNASVAYYPSRLHPFAGTPVPRDDMDLFDEVLRELREELSFTSADIVEMRQIGIVEDPSLRQQELIFFVRTSRTRRQIESQVDLAEHVRGWSVTSNPSDVRGAMLSDEPFTPVARATLLLAGRREFGTDWFERVRRERTEFVSPASQR
ncbi:MAG: hypothetical protein ACREJC_16800 [Tepidisphaeraceae bacterium]